MDAKLRTAILEAVKAAADGGSGETQLPDGSVMRVVKDSSDEIPAYVEIANAEGTFRFDMFPASASPPANYPPDLPFAPNAPVSVGFIEGSATMYWWGSSEPDRIVASLIEQSTGSGWVVAEDNVSPAPFMLRMVTLRRSGLKRLMMSMPAQGMTTLIEMKAGGGNE